MIVLILLGLYLVASGFCAGVATAIEGPLVGLYALFCWPWVLFHDFVLWRLRDAYRGHRLVTKRDLQK